MYMVYYRLRMITMTIRRLMPSSLQSAKASRPCSMASSTRRWLLSARPVRLWALALRNLSPSSSAACSYIYMYLM